MNEQLKIIISAEIDKLKQGIDSAKKQVSGFKDQVKEASKDVSDKFKAIGDGIKSGLATVGKTLAATSAAILALGASTTEYRQNQAQLNAAFKQAGLTADSATKSYKQLYKVIGDDDQAVESAANIAMLASSEKEAAKWAELASGVLGTFHDTLQPEAFYEAANETLKLGEATGAFAQMLEQTGIVSVDEFNTKLAECNTEAEKQAYMLEVSQKAMGSAGEAYNQATESIQRQREAQANLNASLGTLGEAMAPILTAFISFANDALAAVLPYVQTLASTWLPELQAILQGVSAALEVALQFIMEHQTLLIVIGGIITGLIASIGLYNTVAAVKAAMDAAQVTTLGALASAYLAQAAAMAVAIAPYALIVAAIAAVIAIIVLCVKHWDEIKAAMQAAFDKMKTVASNISTAFGNMKNSISNSLTNAKNSVISIFSSIKDGIANKINSARDTVKSAIDKIKSFFNFSWSLPKLKMPHLSISGKFSINPPSVPSFSISWYEFGGVFDNPHLFPWAGGIGGLGENGAEAIVPLEKNTKWLDRLATMLNDKQGSGQPIIMQVDGRTFAEISVNSINDLTRQTGALALRLI